ncbi:Hsp20/alpha crystallin family protein [Micromonospora sp. NBC_01699]|uniref:Hsp20/alpha crystallin family protein n=1 Tax=Micromonospora sp. NBC_01699 TaxID=2975984 RepID=UPI002E2952FB|nr:Hsp20/alpha crystallin family protein [Micromonospora sp. NBC_01699]
MSQPVQAGLDRGREAVTGLRAFRTELGRMVNSALAGVGGGPPDVELVDGDDGWYVVARLPGVAPEEVALEVDGRDLCVRGRSEEEVNTDNGMPGSGSKARAFEHKIRLPGEVDLERIDAVMDHGLLTVALPKAGRSGRRTITVGRRYPSGRSTPPGSGSGATSGSTALPAGAAARRVGEAALTAGSSARAGGGITQGTSDPAADRELHQPEAGSSQPTRRHFG